MSAAGRRGALVPSLLLAGALLASGFAFVLLPAGKSRLAEAEQQGATLAGALPAVVSTAAQTVREDAARASLLPQLRAALADDLDAHTLQDLFATEDWWEAYRRHAVVLLTPTHVLASWNAPNDLGLRKLAELPTAERGGDFVWLDGALFARGFAVTEMAGRGPRGVVLGRVVDAPTRARWSQELGATLVLSDGARGSVLEGDLPAGLALVALVKHEGALVVASDASWTAASVPLGPSSWLWACRPVTPPPWSRRAQVLGAALLLGVAALAAWLKERTRRGARGSEATTVGGVRIAPAAQLGLPKEPASHPSASLSPPARAPSSSRSATVIADLGSQTFGRYTVIGRLGEGGMCDLYTAALTGPEGFERTFVLKRLKPEIAKNRAAVTQFIDEAKLGARLVHSNIVPVFDFGRVGDGHFLAQEYIVGRNLQQVADRHFERRQQWLDLTTVAYVAHETLEALAYAHSRTDERERPLGIVHRDVSPGNILVSTLGEVKLIDFGIVKAEGRVSQTDFGNIKGNPAYMAPEQARGQEVDRRADLFSLGLVMYRALMGRNLYQGASAAESFYFASQGPTAAHFAQLAALPKEMVALAPVLSRALAPNAAERYQTADEMAEALGPLVPATAKSALAGLMSTLFGSELRPMTSGRPLPVPPGSRRLL